MAMVMLKRCSTEIFAREKTKGNGSNTSPGNGTHPSESRNPRLSAQFKFFARATFPLDKSPQTAHAQDEAGLVQDEPANSHYARLEAEALLSERDIKAKMAAAEARVQRLREFLRPANSPASSALSESEKLEYAAWMEYAEGERYVRQRCEGEGKTGQEIEDVLCAWRTESPPPTLCSAVQRFVAEKEAEWSTSGIALTPQSQDFLSRALTFVAAPRIRAPCQICEDEYAGTDGFSAAGPMYRGSCGHYVHVRCLEACWEYWLAAKRTECVCCDGLKRMVGRVEGEEMGARLRRLGDGYLGKRMGDGKRED